MKVVNRARIPYHWSFRRAAGSGEQQRTAPFGGGGDDVHRHIISARLDRDLAATVDNRPIAIGGIARQSRFRLAFWTPLKLRLRRVQIIPPLGGNIGFFEVGPGKAIEASAAVQDLAGDLGGDAGIVQHPRRHLRETRVEMRKISRHADIVGAAEKLGDRPHLALPALDRLAP
jgi:hypothetical protein